MVTKEFKVNDYITLKLEGGKTYIYIKGSKTKRFMGLFLNIYHDYYPVYKKIEVVDQAVEGLDLLTCDVIEPRQYDIETLEIARNKYNVTPEQEFWGSCSNMQVWAESGYDMSFLHSTLAFKLLKNLRDAGDPNAQRRYKNEIITRYKIGHIESCFHLLLPYIQEEFTAKKREQFFLDKNPRLKSNITAFLNRCDIEKDSFLGSRPTIETLKMLSEKGDKTAKRIFNSFKAHIGDRGSVILTVAQFWEIIEDTKKGGNNSPISQRCLLIETLRFHTIDEIYMFSKFMTYFRYKLFKKSLMRRFEKEFNMTSSDYLWQERCYDIIMLGKKIYELALYDEDEFIRTVRNDGSIYSGSGRCVAHLEAFEHRTRLSHIFLKTFVSANTRNEGNTIIRGLETQEEKWTPPRRSTIFIINEYLTLKFENGDTNIYVNGKLFNQCMYLFLSIPKEDIDSFDSIDSIDEAAELLDTSMEQGEYDHTNIPLEAIFWGHCSNIQAWAEYNYDSRLLHSNIAFPLLRRLTEAGDPIAKKVFAEEIAKRVESGYLPVIVFLMRGEYFKYLPPDFINYLLDDTDFVNTLIPYLIKQIQSEDLYRQPDSLITKEETTLPLSTISQITDLYRGLILEVGFSNNDFWEKRVTEKIISRIKDALCKILANITTKDIKTLFSIFIKYTDFSNYGQFNKDVIVPFIKKCLTNKTARRIFLQEFNIRLVSKRSLIPEVTMMETFLINSKYEERKELINNPRTRLLAIILNVFKKVSPLYGFESGKYPDLHHEFWDKNVFDFLPLTVSAHLKKRIVKSIKTSNIRELLFIINSRILDTLTHEDISYLVLTPEIDLIGIGLKMVKQWKDRSTLKLDENFFAAEMVRHCFGYELAVKIAEVFNFEDSNDMNRILDLNLLEGVRRETYFHLIEREQLVEKILIILKNGGGSRITSYRRTVYRLLTILYNKSPNLFSQKLFQIFSSCSIDEFVLLLREIVLIEAKVFRFSEEKNNYRISDQIATYFISNFPLFAKKLLKGIEKAHTLVEKNGYDLGYFYAWYFKYLRPLESNINMKKTLFRLLETQDMTLFKGFLASRWAEYFNFHELEHLLQNPHIQFADNLVTIINGIFASYDHYERIAVELQLTGLLYNLYFFHPASFYHIINRIPYDVRRLLIEDLIFMVHPLPVSRIYQPPSIDKDSKFFIVELLKILAPREKLLHLEYVLWNREFFFIHFSSSLIITGTKLHDITQIWGLHQIPDLRELYLYYNAIPEISGLEKLSSLEIVDLDGNLIQEIKGLDTLLNLKELELNNNYISIIQGLENLKNLEKISVEYNNIPHEILDSLGCYGNFLKISAQQFVKYCKENKEQ